MYFTPSPPKKLKPPLTIFRPPWWRCYLSSLIQLIPLLLGGLIAAVALVVIGKRPISSLDGLFVPTAMIALINVLTSSRTRDQLTITVSDGMIVRLAKGGDWGWPRIQFPLHKVDCERTCRPRKRQFLSKQEYYLWSVDGHKIPIDYWAFTPAQVTALLTSFGCGEEQGASSATNEH